LTWTCPSLPSPSNGAPPQFSARLSWTSRPTLETHQYPGWCSSSRLVALLPLRFSLSYVGSLRGLKKKKKKKRLCFLVSLLSHLSCLCRPGLLFLCPFLWSSVVFFLVMSSPLSPSLVFLSSLLRVSLCLFLLGGSSSPLCLFVLLLVLLLWPLLVFLSCPCRPGLLFLGPFLWSSVVLLFLCGLLLPLSPLLGFCLRSPGFLWFCSF
jgi:hypothetical protein